MKHTKKDDSYLPKLTPEEDTTYDVITRINHEIEERKKEAKREKNLKVLRGLMGMNGHGLT